MVTSKACPIFSVVRALLLCSEKEVVPEEGESVGFTDEGADFAEAATGHCLAEHCAWFQRLTGKCAVLSLGG
jgi:hypothetical protein